MILSSCSLFPEEKVEAPPVLLDPPAPRITVVEVEKGHIAEEISGLARVAAVNEKNLYFKREGRVTDIYVSYGEMVKKGQILARLEIGDIEHQLKLARLDLEKLELEKERMSFLLGTSVSEYDLRLKEIDYKKALLNIEKLEKIIADSTIYAPFDGKVTSLTMRETNMVSEYQQVMTIADLSELELQMNVAQRDLGKIVPGLKARVNMGGGQWYDAVVTEVSSPSAEIAPGQPDLRVHIEITGLNKILQENNLKNEDIYRFNALYQTTIIIQEKDDALLLPRSAIREYGDRTFVLVKDGDYRREVDVKTGIETQTRVEILEGLEEGQQVITR
jgi:RND family efflux transporter MFP subunit